MRAALSLLMCLLCSCTFYQHEASSASGNHVKDMLVKVGGTASQRSSDGSSIATDDQTSFRDFTTAAVGIAAAGASKATALAREATSRNATTQAAAVSKADIAAKAATEQARIAAQGAATSEAIGAGAVVNPITVTPP